MIYVYIALRYEGYRLKGGSNQHIYQQQHHYQQPQYEILQDNPTNKNTIDRQQFTYWNSQQQQNDPSIIQLPPSRAPSASNISTSNAHEGELSSNTNPNFDPNLNSNSNTNTNTNTNVYTTTTTSSSSESSSSGQGNCSIAARNGHQQQCNLQQYGQYLSHHHHHHHQNDESKNHQWVGPTSRSY